eukprot:4154268-Lingulodinium_polyedra.AAC.1
MDKRGCPSTHPAGESALGGRPRRHVKRARNDAWRLLPGFVLASLAPMLPAILRVVVHLLPPAPG